MISPMALAFGASSASTPGGRSTLRSRSITSWRARDTSAASSKVTMVNDSPNWVCENTRTEFGRPDRPTSTGSVTCFSTSSAARPGYSAITVTWVSVTSGKASTDRFMNAMTPAIANSSVPSTTNRGWCRANWTSRFIVPASPVGPRPLPGRCGIGAPPAACSR